MSTDPNDIAEPTKPTRADFVRAITETGRTEEQAVTTSLRRLVEAATVAEMRHPNCGAFSYIRQVLYDLPPELRVQVGDMPAHPEDDQEDGRAEVRRLVAENIELRRQLAEARGTQLDLFGSIGGAR